MKNIVLIKNLNLILFVLICSTFNFSIVLAFDVSSSIFSVNDSGREIESIENQKINSLLDELEKDWNSHNIKSLKGYYADTFVNGDGLKLDDVNNLTVELWEAYPDIMTMSNDRAIRIYGDYATVKTTDFYQGVSKSERPDIGTKGTLKAVSSGELYLKKFGSVWKIISDKTLYEKVGIGYGVGNEYIDKDNIKLSAPEQVYSGNNYTATLEFDLPLDNKPIASITKELLVYPQLEGEDKFRLADSESLERLFTANSIGKNELISATVGLTGGILQPKLLGLMFITRRVNVIPVNSLKSEAKIVSDLAKDSLIKTNDFFYPDLNQDVDYHANDGDTKLRDESTPQIDK